MNWQAYLDGSLSQKERAAAEALLEQDAGARAELEALKKFIEHVRRSGQTVTVNEHRLQPMIALAQRRRPVNRLAISLAAAACIALVLAYPSLKSLWLNGGVSLVEGPTLEQINNPDEVAAANFARDRLKIEPLLAQAKTDAKITSARSGEDWVSYDLSYQGAKYTLEMSVKRGSEAACGNPSKVINGTAVYESKGVSWINGGVGYNLIGGNASGRWKLVNILLPISTGEDPCKDTLQRL